MSNQLKGRTSIPVKIYPYEKGDKYYSYVAVPLMEPLHAYSTVTAHKFGLNDIQAEIPSNNSTGIELYNESETIDAMKRELKKHEFFAAINELKPIKNFEETHQASSSIAFVMDYKLLPNHQINGHIIIPAHRKSNLILYYPNSVNVIYPEEITFIKKFIEFDRQNLPAKK